jgi:hypothetical protein
MTKLKVLNSLIIPFLIIKDGHKLTCFYVDEMTAWAGVVPWRLAN